jgi:hypothetical protein
MSKKLIKSATRESNGRGRMPNPSLTPPFDLFPSQREIPVSQKIRTNENLHSPHRFMGSDILAEKLPIQESDVEEFMEEYLPEEEDFADDLMTSQASDAMLRDLVKLATQFDNSGLHKEAERIDDMLKKLSGLYKSKSEGSRMDDNFNDLDKWFNKDRFAQVGEQDIASDYLTKRYNLQVVDSPDEYIQYMEVQPWQEEKVRKAIKENPPSKTFRPEYLGMMDEDDSGNIQDYKNDGAIPVTNEHRLAMLMADKSPSISYKMSPETFRLISIAPETFEQNKGRPLLFSDLTPDDLNNSVLHF